MRTVRTSIELQTLTTKICRAPGGDDDGSGTTAVLSIARTIGRTGVKFHQNVELVAFAGEEQGLYGSKAYARNYQYTLSMLRPSAHSSVLR